MATKKLENVYSLGGFPPTRAILVIGCGGTGGHLVPHLARYVKIKNDMLDVETKIVLADGDIVEKKNLKRQHFIAPDVSKNKAVVLAERYSSAFGLEIKAIAGDLETVEEINNALLECSISRNYSHMVIGCVDNNASRKMIHSWFIGNYYSPRVWIDSGNEERAGQVICGFSPAASTYGGIKVGGTYNSGVFSLPCVVEHYPDLLEDSNGFNSELSCAERAISAPQNIQSNITAATIVMNYVRKFIDGEALRSHGVEFSIDNVFNTKLNTIENLNKVNPDRKRYWEK